MPKRKKSPEPTFQEHIAKFLVREHKYGVLEQSDIKGGNSEAFHYGYQAQRILAGSYFSGASPLARI